MVEDLEFEHFQITLELNRAFAILVEGNLLEDLMPLLDRLNEVEKQLDLYYFAMNKRVESVSTEYNAN